MCSWGETEARGTGGEVNTLPGDTPIRTSYVERTEAPRALGCGRRVPRSGYRGRAKDGLWVAASSLSKPQGQASHPVRSQVTPPVFYNTPPFLNTLLKFSPPPRPVGAQWEVGLQPRSPSLSWALGLLRLGPPREEAEAQRWNCETGQPGLPRHQATAPEFGKTGARRRGLAAEWEPGCAALLQSCKELPRRGDLERERSPHTLGL